ncbi:phosphotransferase [Mycolicibacterium aurum]|uniref:phosphotransferase n=1 Tax=Mycolicibacterium aurum TaxID=1791 RepID=UPI0009FAEA7B|nr:phosphotransferase [Mycolicibacterium aurum]
MQSWHRGRLSDPQAAQIVRWLPQVRLRRDASWNLVDTAVLDVECATGRVVIKAGGPANHHIGREITAYGGFTDCLARTGHAPRLLHHDRTLNLLVVDYLDGSLVQGSVAESTPATYLQAGRLARAFHGQGERIAPEWDAAAVTKSLAWLDKPHRIPPQRAAALRAILTSHRPQQVVVSPTHGDWQPRNWLAHDGEIKVIDFGRFAWRPAMSDLCRLAAQQWMHDPRLEDAFFDGYGDDPRAQNRSHWRMLALHEAIGTAVWAHQVGDEPFERQGHRMVSDALRLF